MISYILILCSSLIFLFPHQERYKADKLSLIFVSLSFAHYLLGAISLVLVLINFSKFPIFIISLSIFIISLLTLLKKENFNNIYHF